MKGMEETKIGTNGRMNSDGNNWHSLVILSILLFVLSIAGCNSGRESQLQGNTDYPRLMLTAESVAEIRKSVGAVPLFDSSLAGIRKEIDALLGQPIEVPVPKDMAGGYTHERHKANFFAIQKAGALYQITGDEKYAIFVRKVLLAYAELIPGIGTHPASPSYAPGKLFWQCLNDANWLVYASQGYDCIYNYLSVEDRSLIETNVFRPIADHISVGSPQFFNRIHNHSTWGIAGVGMIGIVMQDEEYIDRALNGLKTDNIKADQRDNDGGFIKPEGIEKLGFLAQIDQMFSPDGYYAEGPYYQRYAMYPFMAFAVALQNNMPEMKIFEYRDSVLVKAVSALINLSDADGEFFALNDGQKGMSIYSRELVASVDIVYAYGEQSPELLSIAREQGEVLLDKAGMAVAKDIVAGKAQKFHKKSIELKDGADGTKGAVGILRSDDIELVMKYTSQGEGHGHYDKLSFSMYERGNEVIQDYGLARFVNIDQKNGGGYLRENTTWAKQSIAHNTLVINETSHFAGKYNLASQHHSVGYLFDVSDENIQVVSALDESAYPGVLMRRTMALVAEDAFQHAFVIDIISAKSDTQNQFDLPYYFIGHLMSCNIATETSKELKPLGNGHGYQHLWVESKGQLEDNNLKFTWLGGESFYSLTTNAGSDSEVIFTLLGANDPDQNLRRDQGIILRSKGKKEVLFASVIEVHGHYDPVKEIASNAYSSMRKVSIIHNNEDYTVVELESTQHERWIFAISNRVALETEKHKLMVCDKELAWQGPFLFYKL